MSVLMGQPRRSGSHGLSGSFVRIQRKARRKRGLGATLVLVLGIGLLIVGFLARRILGSSLIHLSTGHATQSRSVPSNPRDRLARNRANTPQAGDAVTAHPAQTPADRRNANGNKAAEDLTPQEHHALDDIIRERSQ
jgi:hypothetical protein